MNVKVCGLTRQEDAELAERLGAWALGFIQFPKSKRYIEPETLSQWIPKLDKATEKVGVYVDPTLEEVKKGRDVAGFTMIQLHGNEDIGDFGKLGLPLIKAVRLENESDLEELSKIPEEIKVLIDAPRSKSGEWGGTGVLSDWSLAEKASKLRPIILAGGIGAENVVNAVSSVHPWGVDLSSSLESEPGIKDEKKMKNFFSELENV